MVQAKRDSGWRGSRELWLNAAQELLVERGVDAVKILPLARKLRLSRTSFYWFFKDHRQLLAALVARWREKNTGNLVKQAGAYAETVAEAVLNVFDLWFDPGLFDSRFEFALRGWALQARPVLVEVQKADQLRLKALAQMFERFGLDPMAADVRARTLYLVQIGYIAMQTREDKALRMARIAEYVMIFSGTAPSAQELERFFARHGHQPGGRPQPTSLVSTASEASMRRAAPNASAAGRGREK